MARLAPEQALWEDSGAGRNHEMVFEREGSKAAGLEGIDRSITRREQAPGRNVQKSHPRMADESPCLEGANDVGVWLMLFCGKSFSHRSVLDRCKAASPCESSCVGLNLTNQKTLFGIPRGHKHEAFPQYAFENEPLMHFVG